MPKNTFKKYKTKTIESRFGDIDVFTQRMKIKDVLQIYYVAVRGRDSEEGAVQRLLNKQRIQSIKNFVLEGNLFFNTFILNWTNNDIKPSLENGEISVPLAPAAAQVIDGQHRLAGLEEAIAEDISIGEEEILVSICIGLSTREAATIFVNINSEQKPVPKSLIYDLFGETEDDTNHAINRANDIAAELNENFDSPYYGYIKFPGKPRGVGLIDLSSIVSSLKKHLESDGLFASHKIISLQNQKAVILNYFNAIKYYYERENFWDNKTLNPFFTNAGFIGAIEHLVSNLLIKCAEDKSFTYDKFKELLNLPEKELLTKKDLKSLEGRSQRRIVVDFLKDNFLKMLPDQEDYEF